MRKFIFAQIVNRAKAVMWLGDENADELRNKSCE